MSGSEKVEERKQITIKINDQNLTLPDGISILEAAHRVGVKIPTLCHLDLHDIKMVNKTASCRVCMVEMVDSKNNRNRLVPACVTTAYEGMEIRTDTLRSITARRMAVEQIGRAHV